MRAAPDDTAVRAAERTVRRLMRGQYVGFTRDDLLQEGRLAVWLARRDGRVPDEPEHARRYLTRRTQGAMLDYGRAVRRQLPANALELTPETDLRAHTPEPEARLRLRDAVARLAARGSAPLWACIDLLASGTEPADVAAHLGVSESRVSQLRKRAREIVGQW